MASQQDETSKSRQKPIDQQVDQLTEERTSQLWMITKRYIECFDDLMAVAERTCEVPASVVMMERSKKLENVTTYLNKLVYRYYELLSDDLDLLVKMSGRLAINHQDFQREADPIVARLAKIDQTEFKDKSFIRKEDVVAKNFADLDRLADKIREQKTASKQPKSANQATTPAKNSTPNKPNPKPFDPESSTKKKEDRPVNSVRKELKDPNEEATPMKVPKKYPETTVTVISKHHPNSNVQRAYRWKPNASMNMSRQNKSKTDLNKELQRLEKSESEHRAKKNGPKAGSKSESRDLSNDSGE